MPRHDPYDYEGARAAQAAREVGHTAVGAGTARALGAAFLLTLLALPAAEILGGRGEVAAVWRELLAAVPAAVKQAGEGSAVAANRSLLRAMDRFEDALDRRSALTRRLQPPAQAVLSGWLGAGTERVVLGDGGWLFYRPDLDHLTGPGFLEPARLASRRRGGEAWQRPPEPDPRPALLGLHRALAERGIDLVVLLAPAKPQGHPERIAAWRSLEGARAPLENPSTAELIEALREAGVEVAAPRDCTFLRTDSHWTPECVDAVAKDVAAQLLQWYPSGQPGPHRPVARGEARIAAAGDLTRMLRLPEGSRLARPEEVRIQPVEVGGEPWSPDPGSPVLLLGDSFTNVYSAEHLGWGTGAGLAERLSFHLGRPIDRLAVDDGGDLEVRQGLARLAPERLAAKRVVVYQLALRELSFGNWRPVEPPLPPRTGPAGPPSETSETSERVVVQGRLKAISPIPAPGTTPYRDCVASLVVEVLEVRENRLEEREILVYTWGLRDGESTPAAAFQPGQELRLDLVPWGAVATELESYQRREPENPDAFLLPAYWLGDLKDENGP